jgi:phosphoribosylglycinamide formyltransferase 1
MNTGNDLKKIAIFASGSGTNAENIIRYFNFGKLARVDLVLTNNRNAYVIDRAKQLLVDCRIFDRQTFYHTDEILNLLNTRGIDLIVLAGFLWLVPDNILKSYPGRIINIHPALLPKYGGKGMYGHIVHDAVIQSGDKESGITIHYVNEKYDEGAIIFQARCNVIPGSSADDLAARVHELEYRHYPKVIEKILLDMHK